MKTLKKFLTSKINWAAIVLLLISLQDFITDFDFSAMTAKSWVTFGISVLIMIFRTYFNTGSKNKPADIIGTVGPPPKP